jgi:Mce-associated membrane protein
MVSLPPQAYRPPLEPGARPRLPVSATFRRRFWAWVVDDLVVSGPLIAAAVNIRMVHDAVDVGGPDVPGLLLLPAVAWIPVAWYLNRLFLPSLTGWSVGKAIFGIRIVYIPTWEPPTIGQLFHREVQHGADTSWFSRGWSRIDTHWLGQTYADELSQTAVILANPPDVWDENDPLGLG